MYANIINNRIAGIATEYIDGLVEVPDASRLSDWIIDGVPYPASEYGDKIPTVAKGKVTWADDMEKLSAAKLSEIANAFSEAIKNGSFVSETLGIEVDCRRNVEKNDEQNVRGLISKMAREKIAEVEYRGTTDSAPATIEQVQPEKLRCKKTLTILPCSCVVID